MLTNVVDALSRGRGLWSGRFNRYADGDEKDSILDEGIEEFYTELGVDTQVTRLSLPSPCSACRGVCCFATPRLAPLLAGGRKPSPILSYILEVFIYLLLYFHVSVG